MTKKKQKKLEENQKEPNMSLRPNILWKVLVFWFFGFLEVFCFLVFSRFSQQGTQNLRSRNGRSVFDIGVAIMFSLFCRHISKKYIPLPAFGIDYFPKKTPFPKICPAGIYHFPKKTPFPKICPAIYFEFTSLKTGLFQSEVAFFLWRPDFFKKRSSL